MPKKTIKIIGIRPPETDITLNNYQGHNEISVAPRRASVPNLSLFYVGTILNKELNQLGCEPQISFQDLAASEPNHFENYQGEFFRYSEVAYGSGVIHKRLRGKSLSTLEEDVKEADICFMSSQFAAGASAIAQTIQSIKKYNPKSFIVLGGRDAQYRSEWYIKQGADAVLLGQAENFIGRVVKDLLDNSQIDYEGVATKQNVGNLGKRLRINHSRLETLGVHSLSVSSNAVSRNSCLENETLPVFDEKILQLYTESCDGVLPQGVRSPVMWYQTSVGCPRTCDFCPTAGNPYFYLSVERIGRMLEYYRNQGIKTLLSGEDNFLARLKDPHVKKGQAEKEILGIMELIRSNRFGHEFSNGLEIDLLADEKGRPRIELISGLFSRDIREGNISGTYRMYWPIETFIDRGRLKKLAKKETHYKILDEVLQTGIPEIVFNTILFSDYGREEIESLRAEMGEFCNWMTKHQRQTNWSLPVFHELPLPGAKSYQKLLAHSFDINVHPELWAVPINPVNGIHFRYDELYRIKRELMEEFDPKGLASWDKSGRYGTTLH